MGLGWLPLRLFDDESGAPTAGSAGAGKSVEDSSRWPRRPGLGPRQDATLSKSWSPRFWMNKKTGVLPTGSSTPGSEPAQ